MNKFLLEVVKSILVTLKIKAHLIRRTLLSKCFDILYTTCFCNDACVFISSFSPDIFIIKSRLVRMFSFSQDVCRKLKWDCFVLPLICNFKFCLDYLGFFCRPFIFHVISPMVQWVRCSPGMPLTRVQSRVGGIHSDSDDHYYGWPVSLDPQWHMKEPWRR